MGTLYQGSESREPNPLELSIGDFEEGLVLVLFQLPTQPWQIESSFHNLLQSKNLELRVPSPPSMMKWRVRLLSVHLPYHLCTCAGVALEQPIVINIVWLDCTDTLSLLEKEAEAVKNLPQTHSSFRLVQSARLELFFVPKISLRVTVKMSSKGHSVLKVAPRPSRCALNWKIVLEHNDAVVSDSVHETNSRAVY